MGRVFRQPSGGWLRRTNRVLIPDLWGESSDLSGTARVTDMLVLIPDLWGESSDSYWTEEESNDLVLIPDLWGESSDQNGLQRVEYRKS